MDRCCFGIHRGAVVLSDQLGDVMIQYALPGTRKYQEQLFPNPARLDPNTRLKLKLENYQDVIAHFTGSSLAEDGIQIANGSLSVAGGDGSLGYTVSFEPLPQFAEQAMHFARMHLAMLDKNVGVWRSLALRLANERPPGIQWRGSQLTAMTACPSGFHTFLSACHW
jgi:hypothetical protein